MLAKQQRKKEEKGESGEKAGASSEAAVAAAAAAEAELCLMLDRDEATTAGGSRKKRKKKKGKRGAAFAAAAASPPEPPPGVPRAVRSARRRLDEAVASGAAAQILDALDAAPAHGAEEERVAAEAALERLAGSARARLEAALGAGDDAAALQAAIDATPDRLKLGPVKSAARKALRRLRQVDDARTQVRRFGSLLLSRLP